MNSDHLEDVKVNIKILLAALWTAQFLLWTFGDMLALLQETTEPISESLSIVAGSLAVIQAFMIFFSLVGKSKVARWANIIVAVVFVVINLAYLAEADAGWKFLLGIAYLLSDVLIIFYAWNWPNREGMEVVP